MNATKNILYFITVCDCVYVAITEGRRFISEDRKEGDVYDTLHLGKYSTLVFGRYAHILLLCSSSTVWLCKVVHRMGIRVI